MAFAVRLLIQTTYGSTGRHASEDVKAEAKERLRKLKEEWKNDPGIRFICYYAGGGSGAGKYAHNMLFEMEDALKAQEMAVQWFQAQGPNDKWAWEIVFGHTDYEESWQS